MLKTSFERVLKTSGTEGYYRFRIPGMLKTERGFLFAMEARCENKGDWGNIDIQVLFSDGGDAEKVLQIGDGRNAEADEMNTYNNPVLVPDGDKVLQRAQRFAKYGFCTIAGSRVSLTVKGFLVSNMIIGELLYG